MEKWIGRALLLLVFAIQYGCSSLPDADPDNGGLFMPDGFEAVVVADSLPGRARHLAVHPNGDIYVKGNRATPSGQNWVLRDLDRDGKADLMKNFGPFEKEGAYATEMRIHNGYLYASSENIVYRYKLPRQGMAPTTPAEIIVVDSGRLREHIGKPIAFDNEGYIYVPFGGPSDACQESNRVPGSPGMMPCPLLDSNAGVWKFKADKHNQFRMKDGVKVATGLRSLVGMAWNQKDNTLYVVAHGRDGLGRTWRDVYTPWESAMLPAECLYKLPVGADAGWPYYYYDQMKGKVMLNAEYGGDGKTEVPADTITKPLYGFPGHWAPNDILFYTGNMFPERYKHGAFVALHGSTDRAPYPQGGYIVAFVPIIEGKAQPMEVFADGFTGVDTVENTSDAKHRPMGLAQGPDGSLYISDSKMGKIWRVMYKADKQKFGAGQLAKMKAREQQRTYIKTPDPILDDLYRGKTAFDGEKLYFNFCRACHQRNGKGDENRFPPLAGSDWVNGDKQKLINVMLKGLNGPIKVNGRDYNNVMPQFSHLNDQQIADLLSYIRTNFGNSADSVRADMVKKVRDANDK